MSSGTWIVRPSDVVSVFHRRTDRVVLSNGAAAAPAISPLLARQRACSLLFRVLTKHLFVLSALFGDALGARRAPRLPNTDGAPGEDRQENGRPGGKGGAVASQGLAQAVGGALRPG